MNRLVLTIFLLSIACSHSRPSTPTYTDPTGTFRFAYPLGWQISASTDTTGFQVSVNGPSPKMLEVRQLPSVAAGQIFDTWKDKPRATQAPCRVGSERQQCVDYQDRFGHTRGALVRKRDHAYLLICQSDDPPETGDFCDKFLASFANLKPGP